MSQVCRGWRQRLLSVGRFWRVIAFDTSREPASIRLATLFLNKIKHNDVLIHVYAGLPLNNVVDPAIASLLSSLRERTSRWDRFLYWGSLGQYRRYLDLPAPRLQFFSDNRDLSHLYHGRRCQLFAGHTPILRCLVTSTLGEWVPTTSASLRVLHLRVCEAGFSIGSLLDVFRYATQLEEFKFASPTDLSHDCMACETVDLPRLKTIKLFSAHFRTILAHLRIPGVRSLAVSGVFLSGTAYGFEVAPAYYAPLPLTGFPSVSMLDQPIRFIHFSTIQRSPMRFFFTIELRTEDEASIVINLTWTEAQQIDQWKVYFERSISALAGKQVAPCTILSIVAQFPFDFTPLLLLPAVRVFAFAGDFRTLLETLTFHGGEKNTPLLPNLRCLFAYEEILTEETALLIPKCLRARKDLIIVLNAVNRTRLIGVLGTGYVVRGKSTVLPPVLNRDPVHRLQVSRFSRADLRLRSSVS